MPLVKCEICRQSAEGKTYELAADSIDHGAGSKKCPGGPGARLSYMDSKGNASATIPKTKETHNTLTEAIGDVYATKGTPHKKKSKKKK